MWLAERLRRDTTPRRAMLLFHYSLLYLALLFAALAVDAVIADGSRARAEERPSRLDAVRHLRAALRRVRRGRVALPPLPVVDGIWLARPDEVGAGEPVAVKDLLDTAGLTTTYGSALFADHVPAVERGRGAAARGSRLRRRREDEPPRVRLRDLLAEPALRHGSEPGRAGTAGGRIERRIRCRDRRRRRRARARHRLRGLDPDPGGVVRHRRLQADAWARLGRGLLPARAELRRRRPDGVDGRGVRAADERRLHPGSSRSSSSRSRSSKSVSPGSIARIRSCASEWRRPRRSSRADARSSCRWRPANRADFMREVADVHRVLFPGNEELYGDNVRGKIERCLRVTDAEAAAAERERAEYRERFARGRRWPRSRRHADRAVRCSAGGRGRARAAPTGNGRSPIRSARSAGRRSRFRAARPRTGCPPRSS